MRIGILTFHASHNYGSMLQAYALQTFLRSKGCDVKIINLRPKAQRKLYAHPFSLKYNSWKKLLKNVLHLKLSLSNIKKWNIFEDFMTKYFILTEECTSYKDVEVTIRNNHFDMLISGGDQIWNQKCKDFELSFLLPFDNSLQKVAYAPSMGKRTSVMATSPYIERIKKYLSQYNMLSVREPDAAEMLKIELEKEVTVVADPVFLLTKKDYEKLVGEPIITGHYMFYYTPSNIRGTEAYNAALQFSKEKGLKMVSSNTQAWQKDAIPVNNSGPIEFLNLLYYADFVCGQSFHLTVFSLLFHKEFAAVNGDIDPRMANLLNKCHIPNRGISQQKPDFSKMEDMDFYVIDNYIEHLKNKSYQYIDKALHL